MRRLVLAATGFAAVAALAGCGSSGGGTTVIKKQAAPAASTVTQTVKTVTAKAEPTTTKASTTTAASTTTPTQTTPSTPPNVEGLTLDVAEKQLKAAGFKADPRNTDTAFGIVLPQDFTVCQQDSPRGTIVPLLAQKYGC
jgi:uncharacterized lipoprotein YajG